MSIRSKLMFVAMAMVMVVGAIGWLFLWTRDIEHRYRLKMVEAAEALTQNRNLTSDIERQIARVDFYVVTKDPKEMDIFESLAKINSKKIKAMQDLPWLNLYGEFVEAARLIFRLGQKGFGVNHKLMGDYAALTKAFRQELAGFLERQAQASETQKAQTEENMERLEWFSLLIVSLGVTLAILMNAYIYRSIVHPLDDLKKGVEALGQGKAKVELAIKSNDEFAVVGRAFNEMVAKLRELDQMKQDFTASVTHELRSPLSASQSFLNVLLGDLERSAASGRPPAKDEMEQWKTFLNRLKANMERLSHFVSDLLDLAKIERGKLECRLVKNDVSELIKETAEFFLEKARQKEIRLDMKLPGDLPPCLADLDRVRQVVVNLVDNAIKYTPRKGFVEIAAQVYADGSNGKNKMPASQAKQFVKIAVKDSGPGIPPEHRGRLFGKFEQIKETHRYSEGAKGTGLGLVVCQAIVEQHGGRIWVESENGKPGSIFAFTLPVA
ncbi:MAG: HAMP domain-containing histidine kinase [Elusimicrobia bacterium]|nr:HAMP domain-containing histidine kinase [Elusimicrobiota bacterium]